jgi:hypothetical protein
MLHAILGLILLIVLVCNPDFVRRACRWPDPRRPRRPRRTLSCGPLPPGIPGASSVAPEMDGNPAAPITLNPQPSAYRSTGAEPGNLTQRLFTGPASCGPLLPAARQSATGGKRKTPFVRSFEPFKAEKKLISAWAEKKQMEYWEEHGCIDYSDAWTRGNYPYGYGVDRDADGNVSGEFKEMFRSSAEVEWAKTFDQLGLSWEYEPLKFDMGPDHVTYTPDFRVEGLSIPDSNRPLYIEVKRFPDDVDLTKYVRFTEWYNCDLLVLAHRDGGVLQPKKENYFLVLTCKGCNIYNCISCHELPTDDYKLPYYVCHGEPLERIVVRNYFLIQAGTIGKGRVMLPDRTSSGRQISYTCP